MSAPNARRAASYSGGAGFYALPGPACAV